MLVASRQMRDAAEAYGRCKSMRESAGDEFGVAECDYSMAQLMAAEGRMDEAVDMHVTALEMRRRIGDRMGVVESLGRLGACMGHFGEFDRALEYFDECLEIMRSGKDRVREGKCLVNMGTTYAEVRFDKGTQNLHHPSFVTHVTFGCLRPSRSENLQSLRECDCAFTCSRLFHSPSLTYTYIFHVLQACLCQNVAELTFVRFLDG